MLFSHDFFADLDSRDNGFASRDFELNAPPDPPLSMPKPTLLEALATRRLVCDGGMGTQLMLAGLEQGASGEAWNITPPERVLEIQKRYVDARADCIISNTFGASRLMLKRRGGADNLVAINASAARMARDAFNAAN